jgi:hypothetical protein
MSTGDSVADSQRRSAAELMSTWNETGPSSDAQPLSGNELSPTYSIADQADRLAFSEPLPLSVSEGFPPQSVPQVGNLLSVACWLIYAF